MSLAGSALINAGILAAFAGLATGAVQDLGEGASLTVIAFSTAGDAGGEAEAEAEVQKAAPPPSSPSQPDEAKGPEASRIVIADAARPGAEEAEHPDRAVRDVPRIEAAAADPSPVLVDAPPPPVLQANDAGEGQEAQQRDGQDAAERSESSARARAGGGAAGYAAKVRRHLMRYRRQNTVGAGSAFIRFTVLGDGKCRDIGVARTSGSSRFDRAAMQMVRRAVPFPRPPHGASRSFNFEITGT
ncbi:TonB family protein [Novosphingobium beihaiensis]|nr:TonB family protein [Novosphingobium beihaiensis]